MFSFRRFGLVLTALSVCAAADVARAQAEWNRRISDIRIVHPPGTPPGTWRLEFDLETATTDQAPSPADLSTVVTVSLNGIPIETIDVTSVNAGVPQCNFATCNGQFCGEWSNLPPWPPLPGTCRLVTMGSGLQRCACPAVRHIWTNNNTARLAPTDSFTVSGAATPGSFIEVETSDDSGTLDVGAGSPGHSFCSNDTLAADHTVPCPCGNAGAAGNGCAHSFNSQGAYLQAIGTTSPDTVVLSTHDMPASSFGLYMQHDAAGDHVFHDGVLCASGNLIRIRGRAAAGGASQFPDVSFANDSTLELSTRGGVAPGSGATRFYATWYRNASTSFCPPATANVTNGWRIDW